MYMPYESYGTGKITSRPIYTLAITGYLQGDNSSVNGLEKQVCSLPWFLSALGVRRTSKLVCSLVARQADDRARKGRPSCGRHPRRLGDATSTAGGRLDGSELRARECASGKCACAAAAPRSPAAAASAVLPWRRAAGSAPESAPPWRCGTGGTVPGPS